MLGSSQGKADMVKANPKIQKAKIKAIKLPLTKKDALGLRAGDVVLISGLMVTGRDRMHKFLCHEKLSKKQIPFNLEGSVIYHCGPVIVSHPEKRRINDFEIVAAGPTTSMRVEMYEPKVISDYGLRGIMGKGGMGEATLKTMKQKGCVYFHTIGGAAVYLAERIKSVAGVWKLEEFGPTEAMWLIDVEEFPAIVTMDAHGKSLHKEIEKVSLLSLKKLV